MSAARAGSVQISDDPKVKTITDDYHLVLQLGYNQNSQFTGRETQLSKLHDLLMNTGTYRETHGGATTAVVVIGTGGVGKTQLARQYVYQHQTSYTSVHWINGTSEDTTYDSFRTLACRLIEHYSAHNRAAVPPYTNLAQHLGLFGLVGGDGDLTSDRKSRDTVVKAVKNWFAGAQNSGWLMVFDNVDDLESFNIRKYLPAAVVDGKILLTSRRRDCGSLGKAFELDVLSEQESLELLKRSCQFDETLTTEGEIMVRCDTWYGPLTLVNTCRS
jgi:Cdc6-like AAA superfamily ATPase